VEFTAKSEQDTTGEGRVILREEESGKADRQEAGEKEEERI
jgi:hypothetical protein